MPPPPVLLDLVPGLGLGPLRVGALRAENRDAIVAVLGPGCLAGSGGAVDRFCDGAIEIEYGEDDRCDFVGVGSHAAFRVVFDGLDVFGTVGRSLFARMAAREPDPSRHRYSADQYVFPTTGLTVWGAGSTVYAQVGVGSARYLEELETIRSGG